MSTTDPTPQVAALPMPLLVTPLLACWRLPFDTLRVMYGNAVQAGLLRRSMLDGRRLEQALGEAERLLLGPLARAV